MDQRPFHKHLDRLILMDLPEISDLKSWMGDPPRSSLQLSALNESDSELIRFSKNTQLAINIDSLSEEISSGLYKDPFTMGWVCTMSTLSDLAATGSQPLGFLISTLWGETTDLKFKQTVFAGINDALNESQCPLLGGDQGRNFKTILTGTAIGKNTPQFLTRCGMRAGDVLAITGKTGAGPALGYRFLMGQPPSEFPETYFRPPRQDSILGWQLLQRPLPASTRVMDYCRH